MAKAFGEKLKILYLRDYLLKYSDENHPVTLQNILSYLADLEIPAERKSIYRDLKILGKGNSSDSSGKDGCAGYGMDIVKKKDQYYVRTRDFTLQEVKILIDMVQSSNSITKRKTTELIQKISALASVHEAKTLNRTVYVRNRVKVMNEVSTEMWIKSLRPSITTKFSNSSISPITFRRKKNCVIRERNILSVRLL